MLFSTSWVIEDNSMSEYNLLPIGFYDSFGDNAVKSFKLNNKVINYLLDNDFQLFNPSPVEFASSNNHFDQKFSVVDPLSDQLLAIRSDITSQTARVLNYSDSSYLKICYSGVVLRLNIDHNNHARSTRQTGFEILSNEPNRIVAEESMAHFSSLMHEIKNASYHIVFSSTNSFRFVSSILNVDDDVFSDIVQNNDYDQIFKLSSYENLNLILAPKDYNFFMQDKFKNYDNLFCDYFSLIKSFVKTIPKDFIDKFVFDPLEFSFKSYNSGFCFKVIDDDSRRIIARGGDFEISDYKNCFGATFYLEEIKN